MAIIGDKKIESTHGLQKKSINLNHKNKFKQCQSTRFKIQDIISNKLFSGYSDIEPENFKINKIIGQLITPFEELEKLLEHHGELKKANILTTVFVSCLKSHKPIQSMNDTVALYRSLNGIKK